MKCRPLVFLIASVSLLAALRATLAALPQSGKAENLPEADKLPVIKELPDPFLMSNGKRVRSKADWAKRRDEIKSMVLYYEYGHLAPAPDNLAATQQSSKGIEGLAATERRMLLSMGPGRRAEFHLILTIPDGTGPFPVIVKGDLCWGRVPPDMLAAAVKRRYIVAEFDRTELAPDSADRTKGVFSAYPDYDWTVLGGWAWGFHRTVDYLWTQKYVDVRRIAITGHSRGGKAALLAGALDKRIALTAPNGSGCGGAGSYRVLGEKCEDLAAITSRFPYWFQPRLKEFVGRVDRLPFDQHSLRALVAPRAQLSTEALGDLWANPLGTQVSYAAARQVYEFLGAGASIGIHFRPGKHAQNEEDWSALLDFADMQFFGGKVATRFDQLAFPDAPTSFSWSAPTKR
jgi:hypothetical protein